MRPRLRPFDKKIFILTLVFSLVGLIIVFSASAVLSFQRYGHNNYFVIRQAVAVGVGLVFMLALSRINHLLFKRYSALIMLVAILLLVAVLIPGIGFKVGNARRWFDLGFFFFQPSEFAKLALIFYLAAWFETRRDLLSSFSAGLLTALFVTGLVAGLIIVEPDFGSMTAILLIAFGIFFAAGTRLIHLLTVGLAGLGLGWLAVQAAPYRLSRILTFFNPAADPLGAGYQINQALLAIGSGGFLGYGFGLSRQKFNFLPEPIGDSIFAIMAEELGFVRVLVVLVLYLLFAFWGYGIARRTPDTFGQLVAVGVTTWVIAQAIVNIGAMVGLLPLTGIPLPFISYGGSAIISLMIGIGVLLSISRQRT